jgi:hypothetical protein
LGEQARVTRRIGGRELEVPDSVPVFSMSTVPGVTSPGLRPLALNSAVEGELPMVSDPVAKTLPGLAADAVKFAPEPTVMPTAARTTARAPSVAAGVRRERGQTIHRDPPWLVLRSPPCQTADIVAEASTVRSRGFTA